MLNLPPHRAADEADGIPPVGYRKGNSLPASRFAGVLEEVSLARKLRTVTVDAVSKSIENVAMDSVGEQNVLSTIRRRSRDGDATRIAPPIRLASSRTSRPPV